VGVLAVVLAERFPPSRYARPFFGSGILGEYTTFSTYSVETVLLLKNNLVDRAVAYALGIVVAGLVAAWLGIVVGRLLAQIGRP
jgi:CrcB protein